MRKQKYRIIIPIVLIIIGTITGLVVAKYIGSSNKVGNFFVAAEYNTPVVNETVETDTDGFKYKTDVSITAGDKEYPVYVRAAIIVTWQDANGNVYGYQPVEGTDYTLEYNDTDWEYNSADGYYYFKSAVASGASTFPLIRADQKLKQIKAAPIGYVMNIEILAQTIQAVGNTDTDSSVTAVYDAWGVQIDN